MVKYFCDKCKEELTTTIFALGEKYEVNFTTTSRFQNSMRLLLCEKCYQKIVETIYLNNPNRKDVEHTQ